MILLRRQLVHVFTLFTIILLKNRWYMSIPSHNDNIKKTACSHLYTLHYDIMKKTAGT